MSGEDKKVREGLLPGKLCLCVLTLKFQGTLESKPDLSKCPECSCFLRSKPLPARWKLSVPETIDSPVSKVTPDTKRVFGRSYKFKLLEMESRVGVGGCTHKGSVKGCAHTKKV